MSTSMMRYRMHLVAAICVLGFPLVLPAADEPMFAHMVFFKLKESSDKAKATLVEGCNKFLSGHKGVVHYSAGVIAADMNRDVNDKGFDVSLHVVFKNKKAHDLYQKAPRHLEFVEEYKETWESVRVFDSYVKPLPRPKKRKKPDADPKAKRIPLPDTAAKFAGMVRAEVVSKRRGGVVVVVKEVLEEWEHSKAEDAKALIGKKVLIVGYKKNKEYAKTVARFLKSLKTGEVTSFDVAHQAGEALTLLELTAEQRGRIK